MKITATGWIIALFLLFHTLPASSCSCAGPYDTVFCSAIFTNQHIIHGRLLERTHPAFVQVAVLENIYRPIAHDTITVLGQDGINCGENLDRLSVGMEYVLALHPGNGQDTFLLGGCSKNYYLMDGGLVKGQILPGLSDMPYPQLRDDITNILECSLSTPSFTSPANRWNMLFGGINLTNGNTNAYTIIYEFRDTIVRNGQVYRRLWSTRDSLLMGFEPTGYSFREEAGGWVFRYDENRGEEMLIYDFTLLPGDEASFEGFGDNFYVAGADSVELADGSRRRRLAVSPNSSASYFVYWIEGVGSEFNTFFPEGSFITDTYANLLCFYEDGALLHSPEYVSAPGECYQVIMDTEEQAAGFDWRVFPNPAVDELNVDFGRPIPRAARLRLLNALGQVVKEQQIPAADERAAWEVAALPPGVYFIELLEEGKRIGGQRVVKN